MTSRVVMVLSSMLFFVGFSSGFVINYQIYFEIAKDSNILLPMKLYVTKINLFVIVFAHYSLTIRHIYGNCETTFRGFFVFVVHIFGGLPHRVDDFI